MLGIVDNVKSYFLVSSINTKVSKQFSADIVA